jgi:hypothetical protein
MAEEDAAAPVAHKAGSIFTQKAGPLPVWAWAVIALGMWYYFQRKSSTAAGVNQQTDPAGNVGSIDPATGYVYGTPEDLAALASNNATGTSTSSGSTVAGVYQNNNAWARAALNYLIGVGIDPTQASEAIQQYLTSQVLTSQQQADLNLVLTALGPPPDLPGPIGSPVPPVVTPPVTTPPTDTGGGGSGGGSSGGGTTPPGTATTFTSPYTGGEATGVWTGPAADAAAVSPPAGGVYYQGSAYMNPVQQASPVQSTPYVHGVLTYTDSSGRTIQTADTPANRAEIPASGGTITGGY